MPSASPASCRTRSGPLHRAALALCLLFGLTLILQVQVAGDGMWFWYARFLLDGRHLYRDLHLALQPLYVLVTAANLALLGPGWLSSKLPALLQLLAYVNALHLISRRLPLPAGPRAVLLLAAFSFPLLFEAERFDDYHVLADCFQVYALALLLNLQNAPPTSSKPEKQTLPTAAALGICCGLSLLSRLNDGGLLLVTVLLATLFLAPPKRPTARITAAATLLAATLLTIVLTVALTGDSLRDWAQNSILRAAGAKGGAATLLHNPVRLVTATATQMTEDPNFLYLILFGIILAALVAGSVALGTRLRLRNIAPGTLAFALTGLAYIPLLRANRWPIATFPRTLCAVLVLICLPLGLAILFRAARALLPTHQQTWNPREILLLIPLGQLISGSLSSGGDYAPLSAPIGILLLLLPFAFPQFFRAPARTYAYAAVTGLAALCCFAFKAGTPFAWHTYTSKPLFLGRQTFPHPIYGPMIIDNDLLNFIQPLCNRINQDPISSKKSTLLSLPFPYPNTFCNLPPWHDFVQTFFDTSTKQTIDTLLRDLQTAPPRYIVYQRQIRNLLGHEVIYNHHHALPHRALDTLIGQKLATGAWSTARQQCFGEADWILIETAPRATLPPGASVPVQWNAFRCVTPNDFDREATRLALPPQ